MEEERSRLADLIEKHAISYSNEPFTLASGAKSNFYFDLRQVSGDAEGITAIARILYNMITEIGGIKSVGGLESGSISLAAAISQYSYTKNPSSPLTSFYVRKQAKSHGAKKRIEGRPQSPVAIVDDVITSGGSAVEALNAVKSKDMIQAGRCGLTRVDRASEITVHENLRAWKIFAYSSPLIHSLFLDLLQNQELPVFLARSSASRCLC